MHVDDCQTVRAFKLIARYFVIQIQSLYELLSVEACSLLERVERVVLVSAMVFGVLSLFLRLKVWSKI